jgi:hypothetical protein
MNTEEKSKCKRNEGEEEREELIFYSQSQQSKRKLGLKKRKLCNGAIK